MGKIEVNWSKILVEVLKVIIYGLLGAGGAAAAM